MKFGIDSFSKTDVTACRTSGTGRNAWIVWTVLVIANPPRLVAWILWESNVQLKAVAAICHAYACDCVQS